MISRMLLVFFFAVVVSSLRNRLVGDELDKLWSCKSFVDRDFAELNRNLEKDRTNTGYRIIDAIGSDGEDWIIVLLSNCTRQISSESESRSLGWMLVAFQRKGGQSIVLRGSNGTESAARIGLLEPIHKDRILFVEEATGGSHVGIWDLQSNTVESMTKDFKEKGMTSSDIAINLARNPAEPFAAKVLLPLWLRTKPIRNRFAHDIGKGELSVVSKGATSNELVFVSGSGDVAVSCLDLISGKIRWEISQEKLLEELGLGPDIEVKRWTAKALGGFGNTMPLFAKPRYRQAVLLRIDKNGKIVSQRDVGAEWPIGSPILSEDRNAVYSLCRDSRIGHVLTTNVYSHRLDIDRTNMVELPMRGLFNVKDDDLFGFGPGAIVVFSLDPVDTPVQIWTLPDISK